MKQERLEQLEKIRDKAEYVFALAGNPNVGKSTIFNRITGMGVMTANYPGMTVELNLGVTEMDGRQIGIVDLPGTYALGAVSEDQLAARRGVLQGKPDVVIVILDANNLARNLYLLLQFLDLRCPVIAALNLVDQAEKAGTHTDVELLAEFLGVPVVPTVGIRGDGLDELMHHALDLAQRKEEYITIPFSYAVDIESRIRRLARRMERKLIEPPYGLSFRALAILLLEEDEEFTRALGEETDGEEIIDYSRQIAGEIEKEHGEKAALIIARERHGIAGSIASNVQERREYDRPRLGERLWEYTTDFKTGIPILLVVMGLVFLAIFWGGGAMADLFSNFWADYIGGPAARGLESLLGVNILSQSLGWAVDGLGAVLEIALPYLLVFYIILGFMEDSGYLNSVAFLSDRFMHRLGLHGRAVIPLISAVGCNVPAVMGARVIESPKARLITILTAPIVPCTARMTVVAFLAPIFFMEHAMWVSWGLIVLSLVVLTLVGILLHELFLGGEHTVFIMELPLYQKPNLKVIGQGVWQRSADFLKTAGSIILVVSVILWALSHFPGGGIESSYLAFFGRLFAPLGAWMGLGWPMMVALLTSFVRKENTIPTLAVLYGGGQGGASLAQVLSTALTPAAALAFLAVQVLFIPCVATVATIKQETHSWKWTAFSIGMLLAISLSVGIGIYQAARLFGWA